jgi:hypothetical protein
MKSASCLDPVKLIHEFFLTLPKFGSGLENLFFNNITVAFCKISSSELKLIYAYLRSSLVQEILKIVLMFASIKANYK